MNILFLTVCIIIVLTCRLVYAIVTYMKPSNTTQAIAYTTHGVVVVVLCVALLHIVLNLLGVHV